MDLPFFTLPKYNRHPSCLYRYLPASYFTLATGQTAKVRLTKESTPMKWPYYSILTRLLPILGHTLLSIFIFRPRIFDSDTRNQSVSRICGSSR